MTDTTRDELHEELASLYVFEQKGEQPPKDIIVVVHDQLELMKKCVTSIYSTTTNFTLYLWDNGSMEPTRKFLELLAKTHDNVILVRDEENIGFIRPNNELARLGKSPYIILLNSDTEVKKGWDQAMIAWLQSHPNCRQVGYQGGVLIEDGRGCDKDAHGPNIDYVCGWCFCITRDTYNEYGLFDDVNLEFAYGEDSDYSLRLKEKGHAIYALNLKMVHHVGNATSKEVANERDTSKSFNGNHAYLRNRHADYLTTKRILLKKG